MSRTSPRLLFIACVFLFVFMYAPLLVVIVFSLTPTEYGVSWEGFTLKWYQAVFDNKNIQAALKVSLMVAIPSALISTAIGTITAFTLYRSRFFGRALYQGIIYIPLLMPDLVIAHLLTPRLDTLLNETPYPGGACPGDTNGDLVVGILDLLGLLAAWGSNDPIFDLDGDGTVGITDFLAILAAWGDCS